MHNLTIQIMNFEEGKCSKEEIISLFQNLIDAGWTKINFKYEIIAECLIKHGYCKEKNTS